MAVGRDLRNNGLGRDGYDASNGWPPPPWTRQVGRRASPTWRRSVMGGLVNPPQHGGINRGRLCDWYVVAYHGAPGERFVPRGSDNLRFASPTEDPTPTSRPPTVDDYCAEGDRSRGRSKCGVRGCQLVEIGLAHAARRAWRRMSSPHKWLAVQGQRKGAQYSTPQPEKGVFRQYIKGAMAGRRRAGSCRSARSSRGAARRAEGEGRWPAQAQRSSSRGAAGSSLPRGGSRRPSAIRSVRRGGEAVFGIASPRTPS